MYYKAEAYIGSEFAGKYLYDEGLTPVYVSDNPVLNAQHVLFEAAKGYHYGLPYHAALASVTTAPANDLGMGQRLGKIKPGFDADVVVWDSDPLSVGATPVQVWIDGTAQYEEPYELSKPVKGPIKPDESLSHIVEEPTDLPNAIFTGVTKVLLDDGKTYETNDDLTVVVANGDITCIGECKEEVASSDFKKFALKNGYITASFTGVGGTVGLNEIDNEWMTDNGPNPLLFSRAVDGLLLDSKKLHVAAKYGVTRAISAPKYTSGGSHHGTSVGFRTSAKTSLSKDAVFAEDAAVHYTLDINVRTSTSYSAAFGQFRQRLIQVLTDDKPIVDPFSEAAYLKKVLDGEKVLALTINSADGIASALRLKSDVEGLLKGGKKIKLAIVGGAESYILAKELADASVGVILSPLQADGATWDARRALSGAPLTNGTTIDRLLDAGVTAAIGLVEDWQIRDLGFAAGTVYRNGQGRLSEKEALDLVGANIYKILGVEVPKSTATKHFIVSEGSPLEIGSRIKAVASGGDKLAVFE